MKLSSYLFVVLLSLFACSSDESANPSTTDQPDSSAPDPAVWEPSLINECVIGNNVSPILSSASEVLVSPDSKMIEPAILYIDQTFTYLMRSEANTATIINSQLNEAGFRVVNESEPSLMYDDGTHGDLLAGDGIYTRTCMYLPENELNDRDFEQRIDIWFLKAEYRGSESTERVSETVSVNESGFFIELGDEYNYRASNNWRLHSPETCVACEIAWGLASDVFDFFVVSTRDAHAGAGYVRVHDNILGTGFNPPCEPRSYCYSLIDGQEHQKLTGIIWSGWPGIEGMNHELGHGLLGLDASNFPAQGAGAWNSGDGMHLDSDVTTTGELSGPFWDPARGWPYPVVFETLPGVFEETYLVEDQQGDFRLKPMDEDFMVWADIFLYMMGLLSAEEVTTTYYKLVNPILDGCVTTEYNLRCSNDLVLAEETIAFTVSNFIQQFGDRVMPENFDPTQLSLGVLHISDRPHTDAEVVWFSKVFREFAADENAQKQWIYGTHWSQATRGLSVVDIDARSRLNALR